MNYKLNHVVVIGSGTMGAAIAAHLANAGVRVTLLDIVPKELTPKEEKRSLKLTDRAVRNRIARDGLMNALKSRPASFFSKAQADLVTVGNLEDDLSAVTQADWVIEVIIENLAIKQSLMEKLDRLRGPYTIVSTNTSGIPIAQISEGRSEGFRQHFLGTHFFNPPRYLKLLEVIPGKKTLPEVVRFIQSVGEKRLGKGIVLCKDTPNFIANRLGSVGGAFAMHYILENGFTVKEVDAITGPAMGRPKTGTFRLLDLVGIDVWDHVGRNLAVAIPDDEFAIPYLQSEKPRQLMQRMIAKGLLGNKSKQGFYKTVVKDGVKEFWELNLETLEYQPPTKPRFESIGKARNEESLAERLKILLNAEDRAGELVRALTYQGLAYASHMIPETADTPKPIDDAMRWGFNHQAGPFEVWDMLGVVETLEKMRANGFEPAPWVDDMIQAGYQRFYEEDAKSTKVYCPAKKAYETIEADPSIVILKKEKDAGRGVLSNAGATMIDLGEGVACVEFHTKMNAIDTDIGNLMREALEKVDADFDGLVIGNDADNFSVGANLFMVVMNAQAGQWDELDRMVEDFQNLNMALRYFSKPVVIAPAGMALGGGAEITMHGSRVVAHAELYSGLVEVGAGVIPAGGGTKEMLRRVLNPPMRTRNADDLPFLQRIFEQIGQARVSTSAEEARQMGILGPCDRVVMNRSHLMAQARQEVLSMVRAGYVPPIPEKIYAAGRDALSALRVGIYSFKEARQITEYETVIANKLAYVMTGGDLSKPAWVSEQYILDLEREAFLSLCGEEKTQERMWYMLNKGKVLRN